MSLATRLSAYTFLNFLQNGVNFILVPLYTYYMSPEDYGSLNLMLSYIMIAGTVTFLGLEGAISREFFSLRQKRYSVFMGHVLLLPITIALTAFSVLLLIPSVTLDDSIGPVWVLFLPLLGLFSRLPEIMLNTLRNAEKSTSFILYSLMFFSIEVLISIFLVTNAGMKWEGRIIGLSVRFVLGSVLALVVLYRNGNLLFVPVSKRLTIDLRNALSFSLPLIPHILSRTVVNYSDRFFIAELEGKTELGIYSIGQQLGSILNIFSSSFMLAFTPWMFQKLKEASSASMRAVSKMQWLFRGGISATFLLIWIFTPIYFHMFVDQSFSGGQDYVFWVCLGYLFWAFYLAEVNYLFYYRKTVFLGILGFFVAFLNLILNFILVKHYGALGSAYAACITYAAVWLVVWYLSSSIRAKHRPIVRN